MLLTTTPTIAGASAKKNAGLVVLGGNVPSSDRVTQYPSMIAQSVSGLLGTQTPFIYVSSGIGGNNQFYLGSGINGGTLVADDRDDAIIYGSQKRNLAGVASTAMAQAVAGPVTAPAQTISGSYVQYPSGWNQSGQLLSPAVVGGETYGVNAASDRGATTAGRYTYSLGQVPISGANPTHV